MLSGKKNIMRAVWAAILLAVGSGSGAMAATGDASAAQPDVGAAAGAAQNISIHYTLCLAITASSAWAQGGGQTRQFPAAQTASKVPAWDERGPLVLPWQGVACMDISDDGQYVALGTIAPPGDMNLLLLDAGGKLIGQHRAGLRWLEEVIVANNGQFVAALCTTPTGQAGDSPRLFAFAAGSPLAQVSADFRLEDYHFGGAMFHYGENSNHLPPSMGRAGERWVVVGDDAARWLSPVAATGDHLVHLGNGLTTAMAVSRTGRVVIGRLADPDSPPDKATTLLLADPNQAKPTWSRPPVSDVAVPPAAPRGVYGPAVGPCQDVRIQAPLSVAIDEQGTCFASADYQGWRRLRVPADGSPASPIGLFFMPAPPTVHVYDAEGRLLHTARTFAEPLWPDLAFTAGGKKLLIWPHNWTSRGLAGQTRLPAEPNSRTLYCLTVATGEMESVRLPDAIASVAAAPAEEGPIAVACWDHRVYLLDENLSRIAAVRKAIDVGAAAIVKISRDGSRLAVAGADGTVRMLDGVGKELWRTDLHQAVRPGKKAWTENQKADRLYPGIWRTSGGLAHSDMGTQLVIEAPDGLILIDPNAGASFEQNWARIRGAGLDPMRIRFVLLTHEHGDHAPGAYLWRLATGAKVVAGAEAAYILRHHLPNGTGYGFHPPVPVDIAVSADQELDLAGLKIRAVRLPGHTYGSMAWAFVMEDRTYVATGDLMMPGGLLGYSGSMDFSAADCLASMRKLRDLSPDEVLGGHGGGPPANFIDAGIAAGEATGWGKMTPEKPNPLYQFSQTNYVVAGWLQPSQAFACGDIDGDGKPDLAILCPTPQGSTIRVFLNKGGSFAAKPDHEIPLPGMRGAGKLRLVHLTNDKVADLIAASESDSAAALCREGRCDWRVVPLKGIIRGTQFLAGDVGPGGRAGLVVGSRFCGGHHVAWLQEDGAFRLRRGEAPVRNYFDLALVDLNGDGRSDLIASCGDVLLREAAGDLPEKPSFQLTPPSGEPVGWAFMGTGDFSQDGRADVILLANSKDGVLAHLYLNTGESQRPFAEEPFTFTVPGATVLRDGPTIADWTSDDAADLVLAAKGARGAVILLGDPKNGLRPERAVRVPLDYTLHYDARIEVADMNADGRADLVGIGLGPTGAAGVYVWLRPDAGKAPP